MKTKTVILVGVLIIALAAMAVPVMADGASDTATLGGTKDSTATMSIANDSLTFNSKFTTGSYNISPTSPASENTNRAFADLLVSSNEASWKVYAKGSNSGIMLSGANSLTHPLNVDLAYNAPADFAKTNVVLSGTTQELLSVSAQKLTTVSVPLDLGQDITSTDPAGTYSITLTLQFAAD
jgi:hypothetical protein